MASDITVAPHANSYMEDKNSCGEFEGQPQQQQPQQQQPQQQQRNNHHDVRNNILINNNNNNNNHEQSEFSTDDDDDKSNIFTGIFSNFIWYIWYNWPWNPGNDSQKLIHKSDVNICIIKTEGILYCEI